MAAAAPAGEAPAPCRGRAADRRETPAAGPAQEVERKHVANCSCCSRAIVDHEPLYMRKDEIYCSGACRNMAAHVLGPAELRAEREERAQRVRDRRAPEAHGPPRPRGWRAAAPHESPRTTAAATTTRTPSRHQSKDEHCKGGQDGSRKKFWKRLLGSVIDIVYSVISGGLVRRGAGRLSKNLGYGAGGAASPGGCLALKDAEECPPKAPTGTMLRNRTSLSLSSQRCCRQAGRPRAGAEGQRPAGAASASRPSSPD